MNTRCDEMKKRIENIERELEKISKLEKNLPKGELICAKNDKCFKWYVKEQRKTSYLSKKYREAAEKLALKKYYHYKKLELESELSACNTYVHKMLLKEGRAEQLLEHPEYGRLLEKYFTSESEELRQWQYAPYEKSHKYEENLIIRGTQGRMLRSKSEAIIDMILYKNGIPFRYEEKIVLGEVIFYPDFVIRHPKTGGFYYWEHFGMMDDEDYINKACDKIKIYCKNGIIPSINLITTYETKRHPLSVDKVEAVVRKYFLE